MSEQSEHIIHGRLRFRRDTLGLTLDAAAKRVGIARSTLHGYESGRRRPDIEMVSRLAAALETSMSYLLGETDDPRPVRVREEAAHDRSRMFDAHTPPHPEDILDLERAMREVDQILQRIRRTDGTD